MHENIKKKKGHWESFGDIDGLVHSCHRLLEDKKGNIWIGSLGDGLSCYDGERFVNFSIKDVLASNYINCIHENRRCGSLCRKHRGVAIVLIAGEFIPAHRAGFSSRFSKGLRKRKEFPSLKSRLPSLWTRSTFISSFHLLEP